MSNGYRHIIIGIFLVTFHLNFGPVQVVPPSFGWLAVAFGATALLENFPVAPFRNARYLAKALLFYSLITSAFTFFNPNIFSSNSVLIFAPVISATLHLLFTYNILEGSILHAKRLGEESLAKSLISRTGIFIIISLVNALVLCYSLAFHGKLFLTVTAVIGVILNLWFMSTMHMLRRLEPASPQDGSPQDLQDALESGHPEED